VTVEQLFLGQWPLGISVALFCAGTAVIAWVGPKLAVYAEVLAVRTRIGQALAGGLFLGAVTSLSGITATATAAAEGLPELAVSNALGGIAAQTVFLAIADIFHRKANLEHAAASPANMLQASLLCGLLGVVVLGFASPQWAIPVVAVHPVTPLLLGCYAFGMLVAHRVYQEPMWWPRRTRFTQTDEYSDENEDDDPRSTASIWFRFAICAVAITLCGWLLSRAGASIGGQTGISQSVVGGLLVAIATSLPELITTIAAVRRGALALAVGDIIGGNAFDTLFVTVGDVFYREGSIYHAALGVADGLQPVFLVALSVIMIATLLMGLIRREESGIGNIGFESFAILAFYLVGMTVICFW